MYTNDEVDFLINAYKTADDKQIAIDEIGKQLNKSRRSIIGKLSRIGIYEKKIYLTKRGEAPITKLELVAQIAEKQALDVEKLEGLEKAPKEVLKYLLDG